MGEVIQEQLPLLDLVVLVAVALVVLVQALVLRELPILVVAAVVGRIIQVLLPVVLVDLEL